MSQLIQNTNNKNKRLSNSNEITRKFLNDSGKTVLLETELIFSAKITTSYTRLENEVLKS